VKNPTDSATHLLSDQMLRATARYELLASRFTAETGHLAPGKGVGQDDPELLDQWRAWWAENHRKDEVQVMYPGLRVWYQSPQPPPNAAKPREAGLFW
jgi:hypothetical protein